MINADKPHLWKSDVAASVDLYNDWFMKFAPTTYRDKRVEVAKDVETGLLETGDLEQITPAVLQGQPRHPPDAADGDLPAVGERPARRAGLRRQEPSCFAWNKGLAQPASRLSILGATWSASPQRW